MWVSLARLGLVWWELVRGESSKAGSREAKPEIISSTAFFKPWWFDSVTVLSAVGFWIASKLKESSSSSLRHSMYLST